MTFAAAIARASRASIGAPSANPWPSRQPSSRSSSSCACVSICSATHGTRSDAQSHEHALSAAGPRTSDSGHAADQRAVKLDRVEDHLPQIGDGGEARTEIVEQDAGAGRAQLPPGSTARLAKSPSSAVSVTSICRRAGSKPCRRTMPSSRAAEPGEQSWTAERLNERRTASGQCAASVVARASRASLIASITLICSAIGMNSDGSTRPSSGSVQRASASKARN